MKNIKGFAVASDGNMKRIAVTYDVVDDTGKVINSNLKVNRIITDSEVLKAVRKIEEYAQSVINAEE